MVGPANRANGGPSRVSLRQALFVSSTGLFAALFVCSFVLPARPIVGGAPTSSRDSNQLNVSPSSSADSALQARFVKDVWPLLTQSGASCVACHSAKNPSQLHFHPDALSSYQQLVSEGRFDVSSPSSLLARVSSANAMLRMPPSPSPQWNEAQITVLKDFMAAFAAATSSPSSGSQVDEEFPPALLKPYNGTIRVTGHDNSLLTYYQLRHKIAELFGDDWRRDDQDQYEENLAQLGGADFVNRFDESSRATPSYLSAVGALAADVSSRAYLNRSGPFAGMSAELPLPGQSSPAKVRETVAHLYQRLLFRNPTSAEVQSAVGLLKAVGHAALPSVRNVGPLMFQVTVRDDDGQQGAAQADVGLMPAGTGISTVYVNEDTAKTSNISLGEWQLNPKDSEQQLILSNAGTTGHVSFRSVTLRGPLPAKDTTVVSSDSPSVVVDGAWKEFGGNAKDGYSDEGNDKGRSRLVVPIKVTKPGKYEIDIAWRHSEPGVNASSVPVSVYAAGQTHLALPESLPVPPKGQADFFVDQTIDTVPYWDSQAAFLFDAVQPNSGVEITNKGTRKRVVADAVSYLPQNSPDDVPAMIARANDAIGHDRWPIFKPKDFTPYNTVGPDLRSDENAHKGELSLIFPAGAAMPAGQYYSLRLNYPGHVDNDTNVPVTVYAEKSSPIVRLAAPAVAPVGETMTLSAASSYNVQHSTLHYSWSQIGGPRARLSGTHDATLTVHVDAPTSAQRAWEGLCRALILHPDFLFTRPRSLTASQSPAVRRHLLLVKLAQDLVGRPPSQSEVDRLDSGATLPSMVDRYLASREFDDFYYRRVRLYLESHGTPTQDEPARLWRYIEQKNLPYTELLTADYTITPEGKREQRPAYCGHSGVLTMPGFIEGKPGLPHFNFAAQVCEKFLGYVFEVTPAVIKARGTLTAASTVDPTSICYSCHQVLTPLAYQRTRWTDDGKYREKNDSGQPIDDTDRRAVASYPFKGRGLEAFALAAQRKERFHRAIIQTHFVWYFGRQMRFDTDERELYHNLWDTVHKSHYALKPLVRAIVTSPEYMGGTRAEPYSARVASL